MPRAPTPTVLITTAARLGPPRATQKRCDGRRRSEVGWRVPVRGGRAEARVRGVGKRDSRKSEARRIRHPAGAGGGDPAALRRANPPGAGAGG